MGNCESCCDLIGQRRSEVVYAGGRPLINPEVQLVGISSPIKKVGSAKKNPDGSIVAQSNDFSGQIAKYEETIKQLNQMINILNEKVKEYARLNQELENANYRSLIRASEAEKEKALVEKQRQLQKQRQKEIRQTSQRQIKQKEKQFSQLLKTVQSNIKSLYERKIGQIKQEEEEKFRKISEQLKAKKKQIQVASKRLLQQSSKIKDFEYKQAEFMKKILFYQQQLTRLKKQLQNERQLNLLKDQKLQQIRYNQLFQNDIFLHNNHHKIFLTSCLEERYNRRIIRTRMLFSFNPDNKLNFHKAIDQIPNIVVIARLANSYFVAGFSQGPFRAKEVANTDALLISLTNKRVFYLLENKKGITYDDYYIIFGNSQLRIRSQQAKIFSNFGISNSYFANQKESVDILFGEGTNRQVELSHYEIYQVFFESI